MEMSEVPKHNENVAESSRYSAYQDCSPLLFLRTVTKRRTLLVITIIIGAVTSTALSIARTRIFISESQFSPGLLSQGTTGSTEEHTGNRNSTDGSSADPPEAEADSFDLVYVAVISMQRSSSSSLSRRVLSSNPCHVSLNEIYSPKEQQSGDAWIMEGKELLEIDARINYLPPSKLKSFVEAVSQRRCRETHEKRGIDCQGKCVVSYKEFDEHLSHDQHTWLWQHTPNLVPVILERNVTDRWKSKWLALHTGDWYAYGSSEHKAKLAATHIPPLNFSMTQEVCQNKSLHGMCQFQLQQDAWFKLARSEFPPEKRVEVSFNEVTNEDGKQARNKIVNALPDSFHLWWLEMSDWEI